MTNMAMVTGIINRFSQLFCSNNNPKAISIPIRILEKNGAISGENPRV